MPCYLLTYHAYGSWMPDRRQGYVVRHLGVQQQDYAAAEVYRQRAATDAAVFTDDIQRQLIAGLQEGATHQQLRLHFIATDTTHVHVLVSWTKQAGWAVVRRGLGQSMTRYLSRSHSRRTWFVKSPSRKQVRDQAHFDHLTTAYLPRHCGWKWSSRGGLHR